MAKGGASARWATAREVTSDRQVARLLLAVGSWAATENAFLLAASVLALDLGGPAGVGLVGALRVLPAASDDGDAARLEKAVFLLQQWLRTAPSGNADPLLRWTAIATGANRCAFWKRWKAAIISTQPPSV